MLSIKKICVCTTTHRFVILKVRSEKRRRKRKQSIIVPDFMGKPSLTLQDILNDPDIPRLQWDEIKIGETIGKGASGLVSRGVWQKFVLLRYCVLY